MTVIADEVITLASVDAAKSLTRSKIDQTPGASKATRAILTANSAPVAYRYGSDPDTASKSYHLLPTGETITIDGYENLVGLKFLLASGLTTAQLFVSYAV